jgi:phosphoglycolate phosphatase-like HAD superfamily hydrolase
MRALALDFDGVISDSAAEAFAVSLPTYVAARPVERWTRLAGRVQGLSRAELEREPLYRAFVEGMPLGNRAEDFGVVLHALELGLPLEDQAAYDRVRHDVGEAFCDDYHERFYAERVAFRQRAPEDWLALMAPYSAFLAVLRAHAEDVVLAVATAKDRESVDLLLEAYGVADLFAPSCIFDKDAGPDKRSHLTLLAESLGLDFADITFVDDKVNHLDSATRLGVCCALASWGFNGERERRLAQDRGYLVLDLARVDDQLFGAG